MPYKPRATPVLHSSISRNMHVFVGVVCMVWHASLPRVVPQSLLLPLHRQKHATSLSKTHLQIFLATTIPPPPPLFLSLRRFIGSINGSFEDRFIYGLICFSSQTGRTATPPHPTATALILCPRVIPPLFFFFAVRFGLVLAGLFSFRACSFRHFRLFLRRGFSRAVHRLCS